MQEWAGDKHPKNLVKWILEVDFGEQLRYEPNKKGKQT